MPSKPTGHMSLEYGRPKYSSKPYEVGKYGALAPKCHLPIMPVAYPFVFTILAMVSSSGFNATVDHGISAPEIPTLFG